MTHLPSVRQLGYIVALADHGHFGRAAEACHVAQSSFSAGVADAEAALGTALFDRTTRRVTPTEEGREVVSRARRILVDLADLAASASARGPLSGSLRLGAIPSVGPYLLPAALARIRVAHPSVSLWLREDRTADLVERLHAGQLDLLLVALPSDLGGAEVAEICSDDIVAVCPPGHPGPSWMAVAAADLATMPVLLLEEGHCLRDHALAACRGAALGAAGAPFQATSLRTLVQMAAQGLGLALLPRIAAAEEARGLPVELREVEGGRGARTVALAWRRGSPRAGQFRALAAAFAPSEPVSEARAA